MKKLIAVFLVACIANNIHAAPVTWSLQNVSFDDGAVATGTFIFDADSNQYSSIDVTVSGGASDIGGFGTLSTDPFTYSVSVGGNGSNLWFSASDFGSAGCPDGSCQRNFVIDNLTNPLTNAGVTVFIAGATLAIDGLSSNDGVVVRSIVSGSLTAVPIPAAVWLFGSALLGLGWIRRFR